MNFSDLVTYVNSNITKMFFEQSNVKAGEVIAFNEITNASNFSIDVDNKIIGITCESKIMPIELSHHYAVGADNIEHLIFISNEEFICWFKVINCQIIDSTVFFTFLACDINFVNEIKPATDSVLNSDIKQIKPSDKYKKLLKLLNVTTLDELHSIGVKTKLTKKGNKYQSLDLVMHDTPNTFIAQFKTLKSLIAEIESYGILVKVQSPRLIKFQF